jgi:hypothetical protein
VLFFAVIQIGNDIAGHINQKNTPYPVIDEVLLQNIFNAIELFLTQRI